MKNLLAIILTFCVVSAFAQNPDGSKYTPESKEYKEYYTTLLDMYKKMYDSQLGIKAYDAKNTFMAKANFDKTLQEEKYQSLDGEGAMLTWIEDNLEKTKFA